MKCDAEQIQSVNEESTTYFFRSIGGLCFTRPEEQSGEYDRGSAQLRKLAVASQRGWTAFSDAKGVYFAKTAALLQLAKRLIDVTDGALEPVTPGDVCASSWIAEGVLGLAISSDESLLAVAFLDRVEVFHLHALAAGNSKPLAAWALPSKAGLAQFAWRPSQSGSGSLGCVVTREGELLTANLGAELEARPLVSGTENRVSSIAWSWDGSLLAAGRSGPSVEVQHFALGQRFSTGIDLQGLDTAPEDPIASVDALSFVGPCALWIATRQQEKRADGSLAETGCSPLQLLQWKGWTPGQAPSGLQVAGFDTPAYYDPDCAAPGGGPSLHVTGVPGWQAWLGAHACASDDHIKFIEVGVAGGPPKAFELDGESAILIPTGPDFSPNYVVGLGMDFTCLGPVLHLDKEKGDLEGAPLLLVATSDGVLRFFHLASTAKPLAGILAVARPLAQEVPDIQSAGSPADPGSPDAEAASVASSEDAIETGRAGRAAQQVPFEGTVAPLERAGTGTSNVSESASTAAGPEPLQHQPVPAGPGKSSADVPAPPSRAAGPLRPDETATEEEAAAVGLPSEDEDFEESVASAAGSQASSPESPSDEDASYASGHRSTPSDSSENGDKASGSSGRAAEPRLSPHPGTPEKVSVQETPRSLPTAAKQPGTLDTQAQLQAAAVRDRHVVDTPAEPDEPLPLLQDEAKDIASAEANFLQSLFQTRRLEADLDFRMKKWKEHCEAHQVADLTDLQQLVSEVASKLAGLQMSCLELQTSQTELQRKAKALSMSNMLAGQVAGLAEHQPLDAPLASLKSKLSEQVLFMQRNCAELDASLLDLEVRQRNAGKGERAGKLSSQNFYRAINSQSVVANEQVARLQELRDKVEALALAHSPTPLRLRTSTSVPRSGRQLKWQRSPHTGTPQQRSRGRTPRRRSSIWEGDRGDELRRSLLSQVVGPDGGLFVTRDGRNVSQPQPQEHSPAKLSARPALPPLQAQAPPTAERAPSFKIDQALSQLAAPASFGSVARLAQASRLVVRPKSSQLGDKQVSTARVAEVSAQPPVPSKAQVAAAVQLLPQKGGAQPPAAALRTPASTEKPSAVRDGPSLSKAKSPAAAAPRPASGSAAQPPLPTKAEVAHVQTLMPPKASQPPVPLMAQIAAAQALTPKSSSQPPLPSRKDQEQARALRPVAASQAAATSSLAIFPSSQAAVQSSPAISSAQPQTQVPGIPGFGAPAEPMARAEASKRQLDFGAPSPNEQGNKPAKLDVAGATAAGQATLPQEPCKAEPSEAAELREPDPPVFALSPASQASQGAFSFAGASAASSASLPAAAESSLGNFRWPTTEERVKLAGPSPFATAGPGTVPSSPFGESPAVLPAASPALSQAAPAASPFGSVPSATAASSSMAEAPSQPASVGLAAQATAPGPPASAALGFGGMGLGGASSALSSGSPFGKGLSFPPVQSSSGQSSIFGATPTTTGFGSPGVFGQQPASQPASAGFGVASGGFGQSSPAFGQPSAFGNGFGQPASPGFGQPSTPGFGQTGPGFGQAAAPGFGSPALPGFGSPTPVAGFGSSASALNSGGFGAAISQGSGFGNFASQSSGFGVAAAAQSGGFGAFAGGGFGGASTQPAAFGGGFGAAQPASGGFGGFAASTPGYGSFGTPPTPSLGNNSMWQMRK